MRWRAARWCSRSADGLGSAKMIRVATVLGALAMALLPANAAAQEPGVQEGLQRKIEALEKEVEALKARDKPPAQPPSAQAPPAPPTGSEGEEEEVTVGARE